MINKKLPIVFIFIFLNPNVVSNIIVICVTLIDKRMTLIEFFMSVDFTWLIFCKLEF